MSTLASLKVELENPEWENKDVVLHELEGASKPHAQRLHEQALDWGFGARNGQRGTLHFDGSIKRLERVEEQANALKEISDSLRASENMSSKQFNQALTKWVEENGEAQKRRKN